MKNQVFIERDILDDVRRHLKEKEITLLVGPRQAGKTHIINELKEEAEKIGKKTIYFNLDIEHDFQFVKTQDDLINKIKTKFGDEEGIVFIDEIERKVNAGIYLKGLYDMNLPYKFVVTGSGSMELKEKITESLVGRKRVFKINTLSFNEFANFETSYSYKDRLQSFFQVDKLETRKLLNDYLNFGGYPRIVLKNTLLEKNEEIKEIFTSYLEKDIKGLIGVEKSAEFINLVKILAFQAGKLTNFDELARNLHLSYRAVKKYLWLLEKTFIIRTAKPFIRNPAMEIIKAPISYFYDLGLRNYALDLLGRIDFQLDASNAGFLFQNFILNILCQSYDQVNFWRTKTGAEVDFIVGGFVDPFPIEVKFADLGSDNVSRSMMSFISKYSPEKAIIVNLSYEGERMVDKTHVFFTPFYKLEKVLKNKSV